MKHILLLAALLPTFASGTIISQVITGPAVPQYCSLPPSCVDFVQQGDSLTWLASDGKSLTLQPMVQGVRGANLSLGANFDPRLGSGSSISAAFTLTVQQRQIIIFNGITGVTDVKIGNAGYFCDFTGPLIAVGGCSMLPLPLINGQSIPIGGRTFTVHPGEGLVLDYTMKVGVQGPGGTTFLLWTLNDISGLYFPGAGLPSGVTYSLVDLPEPATWSLSLVPLALIAWRRRKRSA